MTATTATAETATAGVTDSPSVSFATNSPTKVYKGYSRDITVSVVPSDAEVTWTVDDDSVLTADPDQSDSSLCSLSGEEFGTANLTATITVDGVDYTATREISVTEQPSISLSGFSTALSTYQTGTTTLRATISPEVMPVSWTVVDPTIASAEGIENYTPAQGYSSTNAGCVITGLYPGYTQVVASITDDGNTFTAQANLGVHTEFSNASLSNNSIAVGNTATMTVLTNPRNWPVTYSSDDTAVATVDEYGVITAVGPGTTHIKAQITDPGYAISRTKDASCELTVTQD